MAAETVDVAPVIREADEDDLVHLICCETHSLPTVADCGEPVTSEILPAGPYTPGDCLACTLIHETDPGFCPIRGRCAHRD